jgi:hypothetical protein
MSIISEIDLGLALPSSSTKSMQRNPLLKASIARSSEMFSAEIFMILHRWKYARIGSPGRCTHIRNSSVDAGRLKVDLKLRMNLSCNLFQLPMDSSGNFRSQDLADPLKCNCKLCMAVAFEPPCTFMVCK